MCIRDRGKYIGQSVTSSGDSDWLSMDDVYDEGDNYIELKSGGKGEFCLDGDKETIKWSLAADGTLKLTGNNVESTGTLKDGLITLTDSGMQIAASMLDRHKTLTKFLVNLGVDEITAETDACKMEHDLSEQSYRAICAHADQHGNTQTDHL